MSPRGCCLKMWSLMQAAIAPLYCLKKNKFSGPNPVVLNRIFEWQPKTCVLSTFPVDSYAWLRSSDAKHWHVCVLWRTICAWARRYKMGINSRTPLLKMIILWNKKIKLALCGVYLMLTHMEIQPHIIWDFNIHIYGI